MGNRTTRQEFTSKEITCPVCGNTYEPGTSMQTIEFHIDRCLSTRQNVRPVAEVVEPAPKDDFKDKFRWLRERLAKIKVPWQTDCAVLQFDRERLSADSWAQLSAMGSEGMRKEFQILFDGEIASDAGGVLKEWVSKLNAELLGKDFGLFRLTATDLVAYRFHPQLRDDMLRMAQLYGLLLGKALLEGIPVHAPLALPVYKSLLKLPLVFDDLKLLDLQLCKGLKFMTECDITNVIFESFSVSEVNFHFQETTTIDLVPNGRNIPVTEENKADYVKLRANWELQETAKFALSALQRGFYTVIPPSLVASFVPEELELAICGLSFIDVSDWEGNTEYRGEFHARHKVVQWFWKLLQDLSQEQLVKLLKFVTGTTRLPVEGFRTLKTLRGDPALFTLEAVEYSASMRFPRAHTCFNRLDLPVYPTFAELQTQLLYVILNHSEGFGIE